MIFGTFANVDSRWSSVDIEVPVLTKRKNLEVTLSAPPEPKRKRGRPLKYPLDIRVKLGITRSHFGVSAEGVANFRADINFVRRLHSEIQESFYNG